MKLVVLITAHLEDGLTVGQAWQDGGAPGVTILRSNGLYRLRQEVERGDVELPRMVVSMAGAMAHILENMEYNTVTLVTLVDDSLVDTMVSIANATLGDLTQPNHGILFVLDVERAIGVRDHRQG
jgi:hypothetical protein